MRQTARVLFTQRDAVGVVQASTIVTRAGFIAQNRAVAVDFIEDNERAARWYIDPANHDEAVRIVAAFVKPPPESFGWLFTREDQYRDPNTLPNVTALQDNIALLHWAGLLKADLDIHPYIAIRSRKRSRGSACANGLHSILGSHRFGAIIRRAVPVAQPDRATVS